MTESLMPLSRPDDAERQVQLDRMKARAAGLLLLATLVYVISLLLEGRHPWLGYIRATAEAAMVGGLADWFAVTALFRRPLGLPIPHTAIVASRKDRIGRTLGNFVQNNFLRREVVEGKLEGMRISERAARWLADPAHARLIARQAATGLARTVEALPDEDATRLIAESLAARARATRVAPVLGKVLSFIAADARHQDLLDDALRLVGKAVEENRELIRVKVAEESPWWIPDVVDERIYEKIVAAIEHLLHEVQNDPDHPLRAQFDEALLRFIDRLRHSAELNEKVEGLKAQLLDQALVDEIASTIWRGTKSGLARYAARGDNAAPGALERGIVGFGEALLGNETLLAQVDTAMRGILLQVIEQYRPEVGDLIAHTVSAWDPEVTSQRIELAIGRDLQFIRINGTLVGGLAGLVIYALTRLL